MTSDLLGTICMAYGWGRVDRLCYCFLSIITKENHNSFIQLKKQNVLELEGLLAGMVILAWAKLGYFSCVFALLSHV